MHNIYIEVWRGLVGREWWRGYHEVLDREIWTVHGWRRLAFKYLFSSISYFSMYKLLRHETISIQLGTKQIKIVYSRAKNLNRIAQACDRRRIANGLKKNDHPFCYPFFIRFLTFGLGRKVSSTTSKTC